MRKKQTSNNSSAWVQGEIRLAGALDNRMISLLKAIEESGSINQAAKQLNLSYKGAWQIIERANNLSPKVLISTATGGSKGGGTSLTAAGSALLQLFTELEAQHQAFLQTINQRLENDSAMLLLLKPLTIKTSATNQLFGKITAIQSGSITTEVFVELKGGESVVVSITQSELQMLTPAIGHNVVMLINSTDITVFTEIDSNLISARNCLHGHVIRLVEDSIDSEVVIRLTGDDSITAVITQVSAKSLGLAPGIPAYAIFKSNAVILATVENIPFA